MCSLMPDFGKLGKKSSKPIYSQRSAIWQQGFQGVQEQDIAMTCSWTLQLMVRHLMIPDARFCLCYYLLLEILIYSLQFPTWIFNSLNFLVTSSLATDLWTSFGRRARQNASFPAGDCPYRSCANFSPRTTQPPFQGTKGGSSILIHRSFGRETVGDTICKNEDMLFVNQYSDLPVP